MGYWNYRQKIQGAGFVVAKPDQTFLGQDGLTVAGQACCWPIWQTQSTGNLGVQARWGEISSR